MKTIYQVWRLSPTKGLWFRYSHIPDCATLDEAIVLLSQHKTGHYKPNQFKSWMREDKFAVYRYELTETSTL